MRTITDHKLNGLNDAPEIQVLDEPGQGVDEVLLVIVIDRLRSFQEGPYASNENMHALVHATQCLEWLQKRTRDRLARGVEGTNQK